MKAKQFLKFSIIILSLLIICLLLCSWVVENNLENEYEGNGQIGNSIAEVKMKLTVNNNKFIAKLYDNDAAKAFIELVPLTITMSDMLHEKYYYLDKSLPTDTYRPGTIEKGDIMLWGENCLVLFYEIFSSTYSYTRIGKIADTSGLLDAVGQGSIDVAFESIELNVFHDNLSAGYDRMY